MSKRAVSLSKRAVSLSICVEATDEEMKDELVLRAICVEKMHKLLGIDWNPPYITKEFEKYVDIDEFYIDDKDTELAYDNIISREP